jgi:hypothetical protein
VAKDALVNAAKRVGMLQCQNPPPTGVAPDGLASFAVDMCRAETILGPNTSGDKLLANAHDGR